MLADVSMTGEESGYRCGTPRERRGTPRLYDKGEMTGSRREWIIN